MGRGRLVISAVSALIIAMPIGVGIANVHIKPKTDAQLVHPAIIGSKGEFFTDQQVDKVWRKVTENYPSRLPPGVSFPKSAPPIFHPNDGKKHYFQAGLPDMIAAQYWQCSWLKFELQESKENHSEKVETAKRELTAEFPSLPDVKSFINVENEKKQIANLAKIEKKSLLKVTYAVKCKGFGHE